MLFARQSGENRGAFSQDNLKALAVELGLDTDAFNECIDSGKYYDVIQEQVNTARSLGVTSTPALVINGRAVLGAQPFDVFQQVIEGELGTTAE